MGVTGLALLLGACAQGAQGAQVGSGSDTGGPWGSPGEATAVYEHVTYYPACGNEVLIFDGTSWYPIDASEDPDFPAPRSFPLPTLDAKADASALSDFVVASELTAVAPPGPGDDSGTLVLFHDGYAYWQSDSGLIARWLTDQQQEYNFVC